VGQTFSLFAQAVEAALGGGYAPLRPARGSNTVVCGQAHGVSLSPVPTSDTALATSGCRTGWASARLPVILPMWYVLPLIALVLGSLRATAVCRRFKMSPTLVSGAAASACRSSRVVPDFRIDPDLVLLVWLTPLLYSAASGLLYRASGPTSRPIGLLRWPVIFSRRTRARGLVADPGAVAAAGLVLGAVVAPPDAWLRPWGAGRAAPRGHDILARREPWSNDATALTCSGSRGGGGRASISLWSASGISCWPGWVAWRSDWRGLAGALSGCG